MKPWSKLSKAIRRRILGFGVIFLALVGFFVIYKVSVQAQADRMAEVHRQCKVVRESLVAYALDQEHMPTSLDALAQVDPDVAALEGSKAFSQMRYKVVADGSTATLNHDRISHPKWRRTLVVADLLEEQRLERIAEEARKKASIDFNLNVEITDF